MSLLADPSAVSKFDDPRVKTAMQHLPQWEDSIAFFDGRKLFSELKGLDTFIRNLAAGNEEAKRMAGLVAQIFQEVDVLDLSLIHI